jgi:hypothetical protein
MQHGRPKGDEAQRLAPVLIVACAVVLAQDAVVARDQEGMQSVHTAIALHFCETGREVAVCGGPMSPGHHACCSHAENRSAAVAVRHRACSFRVDLTFGAISARRSESSTKR